MSAAKQLPLARRRFKPYQKYTDIGLEWLETIPAHWDAKRAKFAAALNPRPTELRGLAEDAEVSFVPMEAVGEYGGLDLSRTKPIAEIANGYTYFRDGDVVVAKITPCFENGKGALAAGVTNGVAFGTTELHVLRAKPFLEPQFLFYFTLSDAFRRLGAAEMYGAGGQKRVPESFVENLRHPLPPIDEQRAISAFLDRETAKIDALVAKKERLITLLQEKRIALITRAVTEGLDPNASMKNSDIEWIGKIPAHWEIRSLKWLFVNLDSRRVPLSGEQRAAMTKEYPYYGASGIIDHVESYLFDEPLILVAEDGANLFSRSTPLAFVAAGKYWVNNHAHILRPRDGMVNYWAYVLGCIVFDPWISGSAQPKLTSENLGSIPLPIPPGSERNKILAFADSHATELGRVMAKASEAIDRLKELRAALISAAVTGKIDVREETA